MKKLFILVLLFPFSSSARAQSVLTLEKCFEIALRKNPEINESKQKIERRRYLYFAGINEYLPQVSLSHSASFSGTQGAPSSSNYSNRVSASETIFSLKTMSAVRKKKISYEKSLADYNVKSASVRYEVARAFLEFLFVQEKLEVNRKIFSLRKQNADLLRLKYEGGRESRGDMLYALALKEMAKTNLKNSRRSVASASQQLARLLGYPIKEKLRISGEFSVPKLDFDLEEKIKALKKSPRILSLKKDIENAEEELFSAKSDLYPKLTASQSVSWTQDREVPSSQNWSLSLNLSLPLFSGGPTYHKNNVRAQTHYLRSLKKNYENTLRSLEADLRQAHLDFLNAVDRASSHLKLLEAVDERYKEARIKYMAGKISFIDLESVEQNLVDAEMERIEFLKTANLNKLLMESILGKTLEDSTGL